MAAGDNATNFYGYDSAYAAGAAANKPKTFLDIFNDEWENYIYQETYGDEVAAMWLRNNEGIQKAFFDRSYGKLSPQAFNNYVQVEITKGKSKGTGSGPSTAQRAANITAEIRNIARMFGLPDQDFDALGWQAANNNWDS